MTLRNTILIRMFLLICALALALSAVFFWIFSNDVRQRAQKTVDATFAFFEDSLQRRQRDITREVEKVHQPIHAGLLQEALEHNGKPVQHDDAASFRIADIVAATQPLADQLFALAEALGTRGIRIALYNQQGTLLLLFFNDAPRYYTVGLYLPEFAPGRLLVQRRVIVQAEGSVTQVVQDEQRLLTPSILGNMDFVALPPGQAEQVQRAVVAGYPQGQFALLDQMPALQLLIPVHGTPSKFSYFALSTSSNNDETNSGLLELTLQMTPGDIQHVAALTHTQINAFVEGEFSCGTLETYPKLESTPPVPVGFNEFIKKPKASPVVSRNAGGQSYYESLMTFGNSEGPVATIAVLLPRDAELRATLILLLSIGGAGLLFVLLAGAEAVRVSRMVSDPISRLVTAMQRLARGEVALVEELDNRPGQAGIAEVRHMNHALHVLMRTNAETIALAEAIAAGDFLAQVTPRSPQDRIMLSLNAMVQQLYKHQRLTTQAIEEARVANLTLADANSKLEALSSTDALTGIANRRRFDETLEREYARHVRSKAEMSLILLDVDYFKRYNDYYGHQQGDECLRRIARVLSECAKRPSDLVARYGGEEFVCILPDTDISGAIYIAECIRHNVMAQAIPHARSEVADWVTVSLGVTSSRYHSGTSPAHLLEQADQYLYRAKNAGRNRIESRHSDAP
ncbi:GGDEF domain-containing protein [Megalodesulfovibrio gigas]|uniref:diguanylate cyclase n=1 Tax=Megalodesulfovibrio gigas (strain ATCC 19364 / DSM 1382 / NCIMB 9332 / VKM B-1759) TaxID=1121448 RepID=T2G9X7_MEGG1|nr:diguanylate cyclase [Megalodesulfovibrio gigas]AGW12984.1 putative Two-component response regulator with diguanylate cyclase domain [Megalodesulfovibrio gigas DSM 1382 = ATCC 19364]